MLLIAQIGLFLVSGIGIQGIFNLPLVLPPLDRAVTLFSLVWLIWLWAFPEPSRPADAGTWLLSLLVVAALGLSLIAYSGTLPLLLQSNHLRYLLAVGKHWLFLLGLFILGVRRPNGWGYGVAVFLLSFAGHLLYLMIGRIDRRLSRRGQAGTHGSLSHFDDPAPAFPGSHEQADKRQTAGCPGRRTTQIQYRSQDLPCAAGTGRRIQPPIS